LSAFKRIKSVFIFSTGQRANPVSQGPSAGNRTRRSTDACFMHLGNSFYYGMDHNVKVANKRLLKTVGFAIRVPILSSYNQKQIITTKITKNTKKYSIKSFLNFVPFVVYITAFRITAKNTNEIRVNISRRI
jgi:hypothetical protein